MLLLTVYIMYQPPAMQEPSPPEQSSCPNVKAVSGSFWLPWILFHLSYTPPSFQRPSPLTSVLPPTFSEMLWETGVGPSPFTQKIAMTKVCTLYLLSPLILMLNFPMYRWRTKTSTAFQEISAIVCLSKSIDCEAQSRGMDMVYIYKSISGRRSGRRHQ